MSVVEGEKIIQARLANKTVKKIAEELYVSEATVYRVLQDYEAINGIGSRPAVPTSRKSLALSMAVTGVRTRDIVHGHHAVVSPSVYDRMQRNTLEDRISHRAIGTLLIEPNEGNILVHREVVADPNHKKFQGDMSIQLTWQPKEWNDYMGLVKLLQNEVFANNVIEPWELPNLVNFDEDTKPFTKVWVTDVEVTIYALVLSKEAMNRKIWSPKVVEQHFAPMSEIQQSISSFRPGAHEPLEMLLKQRKLTDKTLSDLNVRYKQMKG